MQDLGVNAARPSVWRSRPDPFVLLAISLLALTSLLVTANPAQAQTDADFSKFCRENYPGSIYQRLDQSWGAQHVCNQGGTPQGIDLAEACRLTTGNGGHRVMGTRVICDGAAGEPNGGQAGSVGPLDLAAYCRTEFPNSIYEKRVEPTGIEHYCRRPGVTGGFTLQGIDLAAACKSQRNTDSFINAGNQVICLGSGGGTPRQASGGGEGAGGGGGGGAGGGAPGQSAGHRITPADIARLQAREFPPLEKEDIIDADGTGDLSGKSVRFANLRDCGNGDPKYMLLGFSSAQKSRSDPDGLNGRGWDLMGMPLPCPGLTGGVKVSFAEVCGKHAGQTVMARPSGLPLCWKKGGEARLARQSERDLDGHFGLGGAGLTQLCYAAFETLGKGKFQPGSWVALIKYELKDVDSECYYLERNRLLRLLGLDGGARQGAGDVQGLSSDALTSQIKAAGAALAEIDRKLQTARQNAVYTGTTREDIEREISEKFQKAVRDTEAKKQQLDIERGAERDRKEVPSPCDSAGSCEKLELDEKYDRLKAKLDAALREYRGSLEDDMILSHGDEASRAAIVALKPDRAARKKRLDTLEAEQQRRYRVADEQQKNTLPEVTGLDDDDGPLLPDEALEDDGKR